MAQSVTQSEFNFKISQFEDQLTALTKQVSAINIEGDAPSQELQIFRAYVDEEIKQLEMQIAKLRSPITTVEEDLVGSLSVQFGDQLQIFQAQLAKLRDAVLQLQSGAAIPGFEAYKFAIGNELEVINQRLGALSIRPTAVEDGNINIIQANFNDQISAINKQIAQLTINQPGDINYDLQP